MISGAQYVSGRAVTTTTIMQVRVRVRVCACLCYAGAMVECVAVHYTLSKKVCVAGRVGVEGGEGHASIHCIEPSLQHVHRIVPANGRGEFDLC